MKKVTYKPNMTALEYAAYLMYCSYMGIEAQPR